MTSMSQGKIIKKWYIHLFKLIILCWPAVLQGQQVLVKYNLSTDSLPSVWHENVVPGIFTKGNYLTSLTYSSSGATGKPWPLQNLNDNAYFQISFTVAQGYELRVKTLRFSERRSLTGIHNYSVMCSKNTAFSSPVVIASVEIPDNDQERPGDISGLNIRITSADTLVFRWFGFNAESSAGTWRIKASSLIAEGFIETEFTHDTSSQVIQPINQPASSNISSLCDNLQSAKEVFRFSVSDKHTNDTLPTIVKRVVIKNAIQPQYSHWNNNIGGIILRSAAGIILIRNTEITESTIAIEPDSGAMIIDDNDTTSFSLAIYLKNSGIIDHSQFRCYIDSVDHGFEFYSCGSGFSAIFPEKIYSENHYIQVIASCMQFSIPQNHIGINEMFEAEIEATDQNKNRDTDIIQVVRLRSVAKTGQVQSNTGLIRNFSQGKVIWNDLIFNENIPFKLQATSIGFDTLFSDIMTAQNIVFTDNFENGNLLQWIDTAQWTITSENPICGTGTLKHNLSNIAGSSRIKTMFPVEKVNEGMMHWKFILKNGNWDPSSTSRFAFWLAATQNTGDTVINNGFAVGVNYSGSDDLLTLYHWTNNQFSPLIISDFNWNANTLAAVEVMYSPDGLWQMKYDTSGLFTQMAEAGQNTKKIDFVPTLMALDYQFTQSRAGLFWCDELSAGVINTGPWLQNIDIELDTIILIFSEPVQLSSLLQSSAIRILNASGNSLQFQTPVISADSVVVKIPVHGLEAGNYTVQLQNIKDRHGMYNDASESTFRYSLRPTIGKITLTEIMADPTPPVGLPEYDFLEITNISAYELNLEGMKLITGLKKFTFPSLFLPAGRQLIICPTSAIDEFIPFGLALPLLGSNDLTASGTTIKLLSAKNQLIEEVRYNTSFYHNSTKSQGGWSMEKIHPANYCLADSNWTSSEDISGGTPGRVNSVNNIIPDITLKICQVEISGTNNLLVELNQKPDSIAIFNTRNFIVTPGNIFPVSVHQVQNGFLQFELNYSENFEPNRIYTIALTNFLNDCRGLLADDESEIKFGISTTPSAGDLIINEILFNPLPGGVDFIEILNHSEKLIDLSQVQIFSGNFEAGTATVKRISTKSMLFQPGEYVVLCIDTTYIKTLYPCSSSGKFIQIPSLPSFADKSGNAGICDTTGIKIDEMIYSESMHYSLLPDVEGVSLEKINPDFPSSQAASWHSAAKTAGYATPGCPNSQSSIYPENSGEVKIEPEIFSPDNDGYNDRLMIVITPDKQGYTCYITFYNQHGREVNRINAGLLSTGENFFAWDGIDTQGKCLQTGIYVILTELISMDGSIKKIRKTCVLAKKL